jgi:hypothetical protein
MRIVCKLIAVSAIVAASVSCGDVVRQGRSPAYLVINTLQAAPGNKPGQMGGNLLSDVITLVTNPPPCTTATPCATVFNDIGRATLTASMKDIGTPSSPTAGTTNNAITINRFRIVYRRADGRNVPGVDVPFAVDGAATGTVTVGGTLDLGFEIVRHSTKEESPILELRTNGMIMTTLADVTFYGRDQVGNDVSVTGTIQIDFANFGDQ